MNDINSNYLDEVKEIGVIVSACLLGSFECNYKAESKVNPGVVKLLKMGKAYPMCPEQLGGLTTPRDPAEIRDGRVYTDKGMDVTDNFKRGAEQTLSFAKSLNAKYAILKAKSPSCGSGKTYDGTFSGTLVDGDGITAKLLKENGITVYTEEDLMDEEVQKILFKF